MATTRALLVEVVIEKAAEVNALGEIGKANRVGMRKLPSAEVTLVLTQRENVCAELEVQTIEPVADSRRVVESPAKAKMQGVVIVTLANHVLQNEVEGIFAGQAVAEILLGDQEIRRTGCKNAADIDEAEIGKTQRQRCKGRAQRTRPHNICSDSPRPIWTIL